MFRGLVTLTINIWFNIKNNKKSGWKFFIFLMKLWIFDLFFNNTKTFMIHRAQKLIKTKSRTYPSSTRVLILEQFWSFLILFDPLGKINLTIRVYAFGKFTRNKHIQVDKFFRYRIYRKCSTYPCTCVDKWISYSQF